MSRRAPLIPALLVLCAIALPLSAQTYDQRTETRGFTPYPEDQTGPYRSEYLRASARWPDARACLTPAQRGSAAVDITQIDWRNLHSRLDAEACLFRILETLVTPQDGRRWMAALGLQDIRLRHLPTPQARQETVYDPYRRTYRQITRTRSLIELCGTNDPRRSGRVLVRSNQTATSVSQYLYGGETFCARYSRSGILLSTSYLVKGLGDYPQGSRIQPAPRVTRPTRSARPVYRSRGDK